MKEDILDSAIAHKNMVIRGLDRQIVALKQCLKEKRIVVNEEDSLRMVPRLDPQVCKLLEHTNKYEYLPESITQSEYEWSQNSRIYCLACDLPLSDCVCLKIEM